MKWKIIADSGCDYRSLDNLAPDTEFVSVPLTLQVGETIYSDDAQLNIDQMMEEMYATTTASKSACPSPDDYMKSFKGADHIVVVVHSSIYSFELVMERCSLLKNRLSAITTSSFVEKAGDQVWQSFQLGSSCHP